MSCQKKTAIALLCTTVILLVTFCYFTDTHRAFHIMVFENTSHLCINNQSINGVNIISMSLYGSGKRYMLGITHNLQLVRRNFPGWQLRIYTEDPSSKPRYSSVPTEIMDLLRNHSVQIVFVNVRKEHIAPMMWRFLVADDMCVERFIVRDADSLLSQRDAAAVQMWVKSNRSFHCIRDHPNHGRYPISGGLWGGKPAALRRLIHRSFREIMANLGDKYLDDMNFLNKVIWPLVSPEAYCSDSISCNKWANSHPYPVPRIGQDIVGDVLDLSNYNPQANLKKMPPPSWENPKCSPSANITLPNT